MVFARYLLVRDTLVTRMVASAPFSLWDFSMSLRGKSQMTSLQKQAEVLLTVSRVIDGTQQDRQLTEKQGIEAETC